MCGGGGGDSDSNITSRTEPWSGANGYFRDLYAAGLTAFEDSSRNPYPGPFIAGRNAWDGFARTEIDEITEEQEVDVERLRNHQRQVLSGHYLDYTSNEYLAPALNAALESARRKVTEGLLPQLLDASIQSGAYGGTAHTLLAEGVLANFSREAAEVAAKVYYENYTRERNYQANSQQAFGTIHSLEAGTAKLIQANADLERQLEQLGYDEDLAIFQERQQAHWRGFSEFLGLLTGGGFNSQSQSDPSKRKNVLGSTLQGAIGGASSGSMFGPPGMIVGGILGGVLGGFG